MVNGMEGVILGLVGHGDDWEMEVWVEFWVGGE